MSTKKIIIGTRGSQLSLIQTNIIKNLLLSVFPKLQITITTISTKGDRDKISPIPLDTIGKGWFTRELDHELLRGNIDLAVHSLKDLPEDLTPGLIIAAIPQREDARESLVSHSGKTLDKLPKGAIIGTDSTRRKAQLLNKRPDLVIKSIRGNVDTRLKKSETTEYDAVILAVAGLKRLGLEERIIQYFDCEDFIPSPGQGALAVVIRKTDKTLAALLKKINHAPTIRAVKAERAFSAAMGGGCKLPLGAYAEVTNKKLTLHAFVGSLTNALIKKAVLTEDSTRPILLGKQLAKRLISYIVLTRTAEDNKLLTKKLPPFGHKPFSYPTIRIHPTTLSQSDKQQLKQLASYDWLVFTSRNGVKVFNNLIKKYKLHVPKTINIAAVGPETADELKKNGLPVSFIPSTFTSTDLAEELTGIRNKKLLLLRSEIAQEVIMKKLSAKGAQVTDLHIYTTKPQNHAAEKLTTLLNKDQIRCLTFTSGSTINGLLSNIPDPKTQAKLFALPAIVIGPQTAKRAKEAGFTNVVTATPHTTDGIIKKIEDLL